MSDRNKRKYYWLWLIWIGLFVVIEFVALATKESVVPTLSRTWWWVRDRGKIIAPSLIMLALLVWLIFHFVLGECALGAC